MDLAMRGIEFQVGMFRADGSVPDEWDFDSIILENCLVTSANPSNATINGAPMATFSGVARRGSATTAGGTPSNTLPTFLP